MDKIDRQIVTLLEQDARQSFADLGQQVGLSKTPCWHRVRDLERSGVIKGYRAEIDSAQLGLQVHAFVHAPSSRAAVLHYRRAGGLSHARPGRRHLGARPAAAHGDLAHARRAAIGDHRVHEDHQTAGADDGLSALNPVNVRRER